MRAAYRLLFALLLPLLCQCYFAQAYTYRIDTGSGRLTVTYHDLRSDGEGDSAVAGDWNSVKEAAASRESGIDTQLFVFDTAVLFIEDSVLSGRQEFRVRCPRCFPSSAALLETIISDHNGFQVQRLGEDVLLRADTGINVYSTNGQRARTANATYIVWSGDDTVLQFSWTQHEDDTGVSLLQCYLADQRKGSAASKPARNKKQ